ncbi:MAG: oligoendopeptidase F [Bilifractor sp.]|nr:oligoendopeptidase F [Lachnospiraceae bacterium]MDY2837662.1 oligoendopeptidase F [Bilifractor sp.]
MTELLKERNEIKEEDKWDLSSLFADDGEWEKAFSEVDAAVEKASSFRGRLSNAASIHEFLDAETELNRRLSDLFAYASMRRDEDTRRPEAQSMYSRVYAKYIKASSDTAFGNPEILSLPEERLREITDAPEMADYRYTMVCLLREKAHTLTASEEKLLSGFGEVFAAPRETAESLQNADLIFDSVKDGEGRDTEVTGSNYILLQSSSDRVLRQNSFRSFYRGYRQHINTFASAYTGAVKAATAEASARHYGSSREMFMARENIPTEVYDNLIASVRRHMPLMYRYASLRKKILGVDELHYYDLYAPLSTGGSRRYTYDEAKQMVLDAVAPLGREYVDAVRGGLGSRWIDVYPNRGKRGGAYSGGTYDSNPYILLNFTGTLDSVSTIAHEMGHSMQTWLSNKKQPPQYAEYTIFVAEVASTCNENLLIEQLLEKCIDPEEKLSLLNQYLEGFKGTVYRQTMFAEFEKEAHAMAERGEALNASALNELYGGLVRDYFGPDLVMDDEVACEWARIPHFYSPFYVYKYATSYSAAVAVSEAVLNEGAPAVERYLDFLSMGGSRDPLDELKGAGVDLSTPDPIDRALEKFGRVLDEAERLVSDMKL